MEGTWLVKGRTAKVREKGNIWTRDNGSRRHCVWKEDEVRSGPEAFNLGRKGTEKKNARRREEKKIMGRPYKGNELEGMFRGLANIKRLVNWRRQEKGSLNLSGGEASSGRKG